MSCLERLRFPLKELRLMFFNTSEELFTRLLRLFHNTLEKLVLFADLQTSFVGNFPFGINLSKLTHLELRCYNFIRDLTFLKLTPNLKTFVHFYFAHVGNGRFTIEWGF